MLPDPNPDPYDQPEDPEDLAHDLGESPDALEIHERTVLATHTPGPWTLNERKDSIWRDHDCIAMVSDLDGCEANARLIAAVPELLAQAKIMRERIRELSNSLDHCWNDWQGSYDADAAIAKATGATQ